MTSCYNSNGTFRHVYYGSTVGCCDITYFQSFAQPSFSCSECGLQACLTCHPSASSHSCSPGVCPNGENCQPFSCSVCGNRFCSVHQYHMGGNFSFPCGFSVSRCFDSEVDFSAFNEKQCEISSCGSCGLNYCYVHGDHKCTLEPVCPNAPDCVVTICSLCNGSYCSVHGFHICNNPDPDNPDPDNPDPDNPDPDNPDPDNPDPDNPKCPNTPDCVIATCSLCNGSFCVTHEVHNCPLNPDPDNPDPVVPKCPNTPQCSIAGCTVCRQSYCFKHQVHNCTGPVNPDPDNPDPDNPDPDNPDPDNPDPDNPGGGGSGVGLSDVISSIVSVRRKVTETNDLLRVQGSEYSSAAKTFSDLPKNTEKLNTDKLDRSALDRLSSKLFPQNLSRPSSGSHWSFKFVLPASNFTPFLSDFNLQLDEFSFRQNAALVSASVFIRGVTAFFFGFVTLLAIIRSLRQW